MMLQVASKPVFSLKDREAGALTELVQVEIGQELLENLDCKSMILGMTLHSRLSVLMFEHCDLIPQQFPESDVKDEYVLNEKLLERPLECIQQT